MLFACNCPSTDIPSVLIDKAGTLILPEASNIDSDTPAMKGKLKASGPDLPTLLQVAGQFEGGEDPKLKILGEKLSKASNKSFEVNTEFCCHIKILFGRL